MTTRVLDRLVTESSWLASRRYETFPLAGDDTIFTEVQGRGWGNQSSMTTSGIEDLISSIAAVGVLQPILLEQRSDGRLSLVAGERRLRALRWGSINQSENPHFATAAAIVVQGPLSENDKRRWQLIENLAREDLKEGELAAALVYERASRLAAKLTDRGVDVNRALDLDDPLQRWDALNKLRVANELHSVGVRWDEVITYLGLSLSGHRAKQTVAAFRSLPAELSSEMDANDVALASRREFIALSRGRQQAADEIWAALRDRGQTHLLTRSCVEAANHPDADVDEIVELAEQVHDKTPPAALAAAGEQVQADPPICDELAATTIEALGQLLRQLRSGAGIDGYQRGTMVLHCREVIGLLSEPAAP